MRNHKLGTIPVDSVLCIIIKSGREKGSTDAFITTCNYSGPHVEYFNFTRKTFYKQYRVHLGGHCAKYKRSGLLFEFIVCL